MPDSPDLLQIISAFGSFLSGIGLFAAAASLFYLARQTRAGEQATTAAVYQSIVSLGNSINDMFIQRPELYAQLFGSGATSLAPNITVYCPHLSAIFYHSGEGLK